MKAYYLMALVLSLGLVSAATESIGSTNINDNNLHDLPVPLITEYWDTGLITGLNMNSGELFDVYWKDNLGNDVMRTRIVGGTTQLYNQTGDVVCSGSTTGSPYPANLNVELTNNRDGTFNASFTSEVAAVNCNNLAMFSDDAVIVGYQRSGSLVASGRITSISTYQDKGLYVTAYDVLDDTGIDLNTSNNASLSPQDYLGLEYFNMTGQSVQDVNVSVSSVGYESKNSVLSWDGSNSDWNDVSLSPVPSLNMTFYNVTSGSLITNLVSLVFNGDVYYRVASTTTGEYFVNNLSADYYSIDVSSTGFSSTNAVINLTPSTAGVIALYLQDDTTNYDLTVQGTSGNPLNDVQVSVYRKNGASYDFVGSKTTNIIGKVTFGFNETAIYRFIVEADGYDTKTFETQVTEDLTVTLTTGTSVAYESIFDTVSYSLSPTGPLLVNNSVQTFNLTVSDSNNQLSYFAISSVGSLDNVTGSPSGGLATIQVNTTPYLNDRLPVYLYFSTISGEYYERQVSYTIISSSQINQTSFFSLDDFGYREEGYFLLTVLLVLLLGISLYKLGAGTIIITLAGGGLIVYLTYAGWLNEWLGYTTGGIILLWTLARGGFDE